MIKRLIVLLLLLLLPFSAHGEDLNSSFLSEAAKEKLLSENLPRAGLTLDSPFYVVDRGIELFVLVLTPDKIEKAKLHLVYASERLAEAKKLIEENEPKLSEKTIKNYEREISFAREEVQEAKQLKKEIGDVIYLANEIKNRHLAVLKQLFAEAPDTVKPVVEEAISVSKKGLDFVNATITQNKSSSNESEAAELSKVSSSSENQILENIGRH